MAPFQRRPLWAMWATGIAWTTVAILSGVGTVALFAVPYGFLAMPFSAVLGLLAGYLANGILVRRRVLIAISAFFVAMAFLLGALASGEVLITAASSVVVTSSLLAAAQLRRHDVAVARLAGGPLPVMSLGGIARRIVVGLLIAVVGTGGLWWGVSYGPLAGCRADGPHELPSGAMPGQGTERVGGGAKDVVWGSAGDEIDEVVGISYFNADDPDQVRIASVDIHGHPAVLYALTPEFTGGQSLLAFSWSDGGCDRTVKLVRGTSIESAEAYAERF